MHDQNDLRDRYGRYGERKTLHQVGCHSSLQMLIRSISIPRAAASRLQRRYRGYHYVSDPKGLLTLIVESYHRLMPQHEAVFSNNSSHTSGARFGAGKNDCRIKLFHF